MNGLTERLAAAGRQQAEREHRETRGQHPDRTVEEFCPLCQRRPTWARNVRAKELYR